MIEDTNDEDTAHAIERRCGFCGCPAGKEDLWEDAADAAEMALQQRFEDLVIGRLLDAIEALQDDLVQARMHGWAKEALHRARSTGGDA